MEIRKKGVYGGREVVSVRISDDPQEVVKETFEKYIVVSAEGNTYPFREVIKAAGLKWDPLFKVWSLPETILKKDISEYARFILSDATIAKIIDTGADGNKEKKRQAWKRVLVGEGVPEDVAEKVLDEAGM